ncbi:MAG: ATP-dependent sacrificial sulfur transferase LarE [Pirellulales bacterium]
MSEQAQRLLQWMTNLESAVIAHSGGVDSAVVASAAHRVLGAKAIAVTGMGAAVSQRDRNDAIIASQSIGIQHRFLETQESFDEAYRINDKRRCFHCKTHLYRTLSEWAQQNGYGSVLSGTNADDLGDYRPGLEAASNFQVLAPLAELNLGKADVRQIATEWSIPIATKPASPCLASRIAYGERVEPERLRRIESAEAYLRRCGVEDVRVRLYPNEVAMVEVPMTSLPLLKAEEVWSRIQQELLGLGFAKVLLDPEGLQSGKMNRMLPIVSDL